MGEEIQTSQFVPEDYERFQKYLEAETELLKEWFASSFLDNSEPTGGFELEAWLLDQQHRPAPLNEPYLQQLAEPLASPELASFNFEVNSTPRLLNGHVFSAMHNELSQTWNHCQQVAADMDTKVTMIGILPTVENEALHLANMSQMERYRALNREVVRMRKGKPLVFDITGEEHLKVTHRDVMLESAATSFQIHLQLSQSQAARLFNASTVLAGPIVALTANSPYLFGKDLWAETRIPVFEQAVAVGGFEGAAFGPIKRVTFGSGYIRDSLLECFIENLEHYPILLPVDFDNDIEKLQHLRLHNGTIWRWNRPLVGFNEAGEPHLRVEHRVVPAGPSVIDTIANAAFYFGTVTALANLPEPIETQLEFDKARDNFYTAARFGLRTSLNWKDKQVTVSELLLEELLPLAKEGLEYLDIASSDIREYLGVIKSRVEAGINGAQWQRAFVNKHGRDMEALTAAYFERQESNKPVHEWTV